MPDQSTVQLYTILFSLFLYTSSSFLLILMQVTAPLCSLRASFITCPFGVTSHILTWPSPPPLTTRLLSDVQASAVTPWKKKNTYKSPWYGDIIFISRYFTIPEIWMFLKKQDYGDIVCNPSYREKCIKTIPEMRTPHKLTIYYKLLSFLHCISSIWRGLWYLVVSIVDGVHRFARLREIRTNLSIIPGWNLLDTHKCYSTQHTLYISIVVQRQNAIANDSKA